mgnify:CR=1 FL=1
MLFLMNNFFNELVSCKFYSLDIVSFEDVEGSMKNDKIYTILSLF